MRRLRPTLRFYATGMKLASELVLDPLLTQVLPRLAHQGDTREPPFLDARRHARRSDEVDDPRASRDAGAWPAEPPQRIQNADPRHAEVVTCGGVAHDQTPEVIDEGQHRHCGQHAWHGVAVQHVHRHRGLALRQGGVEVIIATPTTMDLVVQTQVDQRTRARRSGSRSCAPRGRPSPSARGGGV